MKNLKALVADDHPLFRKMVVRSLLESNLCSAIHEVEDGEQALQFCETQVIDLLILDISMPKMDGLAVAKAILKNPKLARIKIIVITIYDDPRFVYGVLQLGIKGYLSKRCIPEELRAAVEAVINGKIYYPEVYNEPIKRLITEKPVLHAISNSERTLIFHISRGLSNKEISQLLNTPLRTIETQRARLEKKLLVKNGSELIDFAYRNGILSINSPEL